MITFNPLDLGSKDTIEKYFKNADNHFADLNFTNLFVWSNGFCPSWAEIGNSLVICMEPDAKPSFTFPVGTEPVRDVLAALKEVSDEAGVSLTIRNVPKDKIDMLQEMFDNSFDVSLKESYSDYVYLAENLATLAGKKLHGKRNHINRFEMQGEWHTEMITDENLHISRDFAENWFSKSSEEKDMSYDGEIRAINLLFDNFDALSAEGMLLFQRETPVAFTFGEVLSRDTFLCHFEKALDDLNGAYPMINREFSKHIVSTYPQIKYINREEDMGLEGLRHAKTSYQPEFMADKYNLTLKTL